MAPSPSPLEDLFHPPTTDDPYWTETAWFGFSVPEQALAGAVYPVFRPNLGICSCGVYVWDERAEDAWEIPYARTYWHLPMPNVELTDLSLPVGLSYTCLEPLRRYRVRYQDGDEIELDFVFEGLRAPHAIVLTSESGHLDQAGRVTGTLRLHGREITLDCFEMRDRSWGIRADHGPVRAGYSYGTASPDHAFHAMAIGSPDEEIVVGGFHVRDGVEADIVSGQRHVVRERGRPLSVAIKARDSEGRDLQAEGVYLNRFAFQSSPNYFAWMSLTSWSLDGCEAFGEDQDVWSPDLLRSLRGS